MSRTIYYSSESISALDERGGFFFPSEKLVWTLFQQVFMSVTTREVNGHNAEDSHLVYKKHQSTCLSSVVFTDLAAVYWLADAEAIKEVSINVGTTFDKDMSVYKKGMGPGINFLGENIVGSNGRTWRRHRALVNPGFNEANNALVWHQTSQIVEEWSRAIDASTKDGSYEMNAFEELKQLTLRTFMSTTFGMRSRWDHVETDINETSDITSIFATTERYIIPKVLLPEWAYRLFEAVHVPLVSPWLSMTKKVFDYLNQQLIETISSSRADLLEAQTKDAESMDGVLLRSLISANMAVEGDDIGSSNRGLTDEELMSNLFILLLAGHETTAHTLSLALSLLALYPDAQRRVYDEVCQVWPRDLPPATELPESDHKAVISKLTYTNAVVHETIRHFPAVSRLGREVIQDTVIKARRFRKAGAGAKYETESFTVPLRKGDKVLIDIPGLHANPLYWGDDAEEFNPEKFIDTETYRWPREAFLAFSAGSRSCIGQKFALTEGVCALAMLIRRYEFLVPSRLEGKTFEEQKRVMLEWRPHATNVPCHSWVRVRRR
ncbi:hypothetical protein V5O48_012235 [Marasmius crinis-equi]|uniref:Cytochrome P450 n=1 Tax=Marasmius crinis-equi TaxID=585013 RepID=A0ABR3F3B7_9AGAR